MIIVGNTVKSCLCYGGIDLSNYLSSISKSGSSIAQFLEDNKASRLKCENPGSYIKFLMKGIRYLMEMVLGWKKLVYRRRTA